MSVSASPASSFQWWVNTLVQRRVISAGTAKVGIAARQGDSTEWQEAYSIISSSWFDDEQFGFDWGSNPGELVSTKLYDLDPSYECLLYVAVLNQVDALGWPENLAGSVLSVTVPSITFELDMVQVLSPG